MNTKLRSLIPAIFIAIIVSFTLAPSHSVAAPTDTRPLLSSLPASDVVMFVDLQRIMTEIIPRLLAKDPATLAKMTAAINEVKIKSGVNILAIDSVVAGMQFDGAVTHNMKKENFGIVIIAHGDFDANALIAFLKRETKGKVHEETYGGKVIYSEPQPAKKKAERELAALTVLDANTVALGDLPQVRAAVDAFAGKGRVDSSLVGLAAGDSSSLIGLAGNVPPSLIEDLKETAPQNDPTAQAIQKAITGLKQLFVSIGATPSDFNIITGARLSNAEQAASLGDMLMGLRQQAIAGVDEQEIRSLIESTKITTQGDEVLIKADIKNEDVQDFVASMMKDEKPVAKPTPKPKRTTKHRRSSRRRRH
ncbi:MAG: hypothetical protein QOJ02_4213 [Acidobacteriota bacterium]|jgi:hypothetical protein|nr:hypothetical protein [Acidobacteriota bacterium]